MTKHYSQWIKSIHLLLALSIVVAYVLSYFEQLLSIHLLFGLLAVITVMVRLVWFFFAKHEGRLSKFDFRLKALYAYTTNYKAFDPKGKKNPASSYSAISIWLLVLALGIVGMMLVGAKFGSGLFSFLYTHEKATIHTLKEIHELLGTLLIVVAFIHVTGVLLETFVKKSGIIKSMMHIKMLTLLLVVSIVLLVTWLFIANLNSLVQTDQRFLIQTQNVTPTMHTNCKECHIYYPTDLLPQQEWHAMMNDLENHYGDDASVESEEIEQMKKEYDALGLKTFVIKKGTFNTSVTETKYWKKKHDMFDKSFWKSEKLKPTQCKACHLQIEHNSYNTLMMPLKYALYIK